MNSKQDTLFIFFAMLTLALVYTASDIYLPALPTIQTYFSASIDQAQYTVTTYLLGWGIAQFIAGPIIDHLGYRKILLFCIVSFIITTLICAFSINLDLLIFARAFQSIFAGMIGVTARASFIKRFDITRAAYLLMTLTPTIMLSTILAPIVGGYLVYSMGWRSIFIFLVLYSAVILYGTYRYFYVSEGNTNRIGLHPKAILRTYAEILFHRPFIQCLLINGMTIGILFTYFTEAPFIYHAAGYSAQIIGLTFIPIAAAFLLASQLNRFLYKHFSMGQLIIIASFFLIAGQILMAAPAFYSMGLMPMTIGITICTFGMGFSSPIAFSKAATLFPERAGYASSVLTALPYIFTTLLTLIVHPICGNNVGILALFLFVITITCVTAYCVVGSSKQNINEVVL
ncbi:MAG: multidrug effflux MFS transporter [Legionellales bacterium]|nr:multidrug effflux MFS transporter [Legionellales bacterium]